ncbi:hypothetical protein [Oceanirhabdus sp. W0125-5]|uniref:hypothetical protein n=1 Tax=Oceanirhabdus sp. W0125-5 TaxID=2999116 RepID=UPI0022F2C121|nr:hypothetical protein [Oceanirhabdus sp. W0125-5]WBW98889.1 hypothetical protein OW730_09140 [Oceanirhabdus sp. W0125-5]
MIVFIFILSMIISFVLFKFLVAFGSVYDTQGYIGVSTMIIISTIVTCSIYIVSKIKENFDTEENNQKSTDNIVDQLIQLRDDGILNDNELELKISQYKEYEKIERKKNKFKKKSEFLLSIKEKGILSEDEYNNKLDSLKKLYDESKE